MKIANHKLVDVPYKAARSFGGAMAPDLIVVHDTAGRVDKFSSVNWFCSPDCNTSAHVVIERDGTITQQVPFNRKAWHAGASSYKGRQGCNSFAIGIEIVNPGKLDKDGRAWFHKKTEKGFDGAKRVKTKEHGDGWWVDYTPEQIEAVSELCRALVEKYPAITDITTHWFISPGRKVDTNPLFPLEAVREAAFAPRGEGQVAALPPIEPTAEKPITAVSAAAQSKTVWTLLSAGALKIIETFTDWLQAAWETMLSLVGLLPTVTKDVKEQADSVEQISTWLKFDPKVAATLVSAIVLVGIVIAIVRHTNDKRELLNAK